MKYPSPYLLKELRERRQAARVRVAHYRQYDSACAKADVEQAEKDAQVYSEVLACLDPKERWQ